MYCTILASISTLPALAQLTRLSLRGCYKSNDTSKILGSAGVRVLARALADNTCVTCVDLRGNNMTCEHLELLLPALVSLPSLRALDLSYNRMTASDACHVICALAYAAVRRGGVSCSNLSMEGNGFIPEDVVACSTWAHDLRLPQPPVQVVTKGFGHIVTYLSGWG